MFGFKKKPKTFALSMPVTGKAEPLELVHDDVFSQKMLGDGFAAVPADGAVYSPIEAKVTSIFPTKHAISLMAANNVEVLVHMGIDTVELNGDGIDVLVSESQSVDSSTQLASIDLEKLSQAEKDPTVMVVFTNLADHDLSVDPGEHQHSEKLGELELK